MRTNRNRIMLALVIIVMLFLSACRVGNDRFELTNYVDGNIDTFRKRTGVQVENRSNGVYLLEDTIQLIAPKGNITSITLMNQAENFTLYKVGIGMSKSEVDQVLSEKFGREDLIKRNTENNSFTYTYLGGEHKLYVSFDMDTENVIEVSYYNNDMGNDSRDEAGIPYAGELLAMIGDVRVYYNEAMVYLNSVQVNYEAEYGKDIWNSVMFGNGITFGSLIKDEVMRQITELKIIRRKAEELGIYLAEDELAQVKAYAREHYEGLTNEDKERYYITEELLETVYADNVLAEKTFETVTINVDTRVPDIEAQQITVQHILISGITYNDEGDKVPLSTEDRLAAHEKVKALLEQAKNTDDFYAIAEANTDADIIEYTFGRGEGPKEFSATFEQAAFTLKTGEISDIISTDYGWHIIYSVTDFNRDATTQVKERIIEERRNKMFSELYSEWAMNYDVVVNSEAWKAIPFK